MQYLGLDIGGTKIAAALFNEAGEQLYYQRYNTIKSDYGAFLTHVITIIEQAASCADESISIGIGLPGAICPGTQKIKNSNILALNGQALKEDLEAHLKATVHIANDADCFALSEALFGAAKNHGSAFGVIIGTGCGGGVVHDKQLVKGPNNVAGEWGHNQLAFYDKAEDGKTENCYCGRAACNELFLSGTGFAKQYNDKHATNLSSQEIIALKSGSESAKRHYELYLDQLARALSQVINFFDPQAIVLGGGMSNVLSIYDDLPAYLPQYVFGGYCKTPILKAELGDDSGVKGAAFLGLSS
ncbi:ROK family protein [Vibrio campbellii]|uniref:ROK family protein n=1 Tax=Vibrio campbellii TaxID=680 RepID=UPI00142DE7ED|nr:ROK family protein [Vibrio campbellii]NIY86684.1 ROK family protein [Vibrio campbellii]NVK71142.1 ROK family protein [Vibrio campbellii]